MNVVTEELARRMVMSSGEWPEDVDEFQLAGLTPRGAGQAYCVKAATAKTSCSGLVGLSTMVVPGYAACGSTRELV